MIDPTTLLQFPGWLRNAVTNGQSTSQLAQLPGTTLAAVLVVLKDMAGAGSRRRREAKKRG